MRSTSVTESLTKIFPKLDIRYNIGTKNSYTYTHDELDSLLEQAQHREMCWFLIQPGMGKSTELTDLSKQIKQ